MKRIKKTPGKLFRKMGFEIHRVKEGFHYCPKIYGHKHWKLADIREIDGFKELADKVVSHKRTYLDYARLHVIYQAINNVRHLQKDKAYLCEVGVFRGGGTYFIAEAAAKLCNTETQVFSIDTFEGHPDDIDLRVDGEHAYGLFNATSYEEVKKYLSNLHNVSVLKGRFQDHTNNLADKKFSFAHLDVDIYSGTAAGLEFFAEALLQGGIIVVDDYGFTTCEGAKEAVDEFLVKNNDFVSFHLITGQCLLVKIS